MYTVDSIPLIELARELNLSVFSVLAKMAVTVEDDHRPTPSNTTR